MYLSFQTGDKERLEIVLVDERPGAVQGAARERPGAAQGAAREQLGAAQGTVRDQELEEEEEEVELLNTTFFKNNETFAFYFWATIPPFNFLV